ncbi:MAG: SGNH/GDSL hydrolase family protein [Clostridia bacterium]|nr:SGNH/GDSL hydrolase family protein [Clostridia bacterium]
MKITKEMGVVLKDTTIDSGNPVFIDVENKPFKIYGACDKYLRVPTEVAQNTSANVAKLSKYTTGVRIRFKTDSDYIIAHFSLKSYDQFSTYDIQAVADCFCEDETGYHCLGKFNPSQGEGKNYFECRIRVKPTLKDIMICLPIYSEIDKFYVGLREGCELSESTEYKYTTPIVFYGSSIVHGIGASRPSSTYPMIISRKLNSDVVNLGFAGAALAEKAIIEYISGLNMSVFVYDYDHNAPDPEYLEKTHYAGYEMFRKAQPNTPVIMASKPDYYNPFSDIEVNEKRRQIIIESYKKGIANGDKNLYFVDGKEFYDPEFREESTADGCHPNDVGYLQMAKTFGNLLKLLIDKKE